jgi:hypothetical protein
MTALRGALPPVEEYFDIPTASLLEQNMKAAEDYFPK